MFSVDFSIATNNTLGPKWLAASAQQLTVCYSFSLVTMDAVKNLPQGYARYNKTNSAQKSLAMMSFTTSTPRW
jgi:hypothetical protein